MTHKEFMTNARAFFDECLRTLDEKGQDYAGEDDAFKNFRFCEKIGICTSETGVLHRIGEKLCRVINLRNRSPKVSEEPKPKTVVDIVNYLFILTQIWEEDARFQSLEKNP